MNRLTIEKKESDYYTVEVDAHSFESQDIPGALEIVSITPELKDDVLRLLSVLFEELKAEYVIVERFGELWYASATVPVVKNYTNNYYNVEEYDLVSVLAALETAVRSGWDDESGLDSINRFLTWAWFI